MGKVLAEGWRRQIWGGGRQVVRVEFRWATQTAAPPPHAMHLHAATAWRSSAPGGAAARRSQPGSGSVALWLRPPNDRVHPRGALPSGARLGAPSGATRS